MTTIEPGITTVSTEFDISGSVLEVILAAATIIVVNMLTKLVNNAGKNLDVAPPQLR